MTVYITEEEAMQYLIERLQQEFPNKQVEVSRRAVRSGTPSSVYYLANLVEKKHY